MAKFVVTEQMYYRQGRKYQPGDVVDLPDGEKPAPHWKKVEEPPASVKSAAVDVSPAPPTPAFDGKSKKGGGASNPI